MAPLMLDRSITHRGQQCNKNHTAVLFTYCKIPRHGSGSLASVWQPPFLPDATVKCLACFAGPVGPALLLQSFQAAKDNRHAPPCIATTPAQLTQWWATMQRAQHRSGTSPATKRAHTLPYTTSRPMTERAFQHRAQLRQTQAEQAKPS